MLLLLSCVLALSPDVHQDGPPSSGGRCSHGATVVGGGVHMSCTNFTPKFNWRRWARLNRTTGNYSKFSTVLLDSELFIFNATVGDSGQYRCSDRVSEMYYCDISLTVVEPLSAVSVSATPEQPVAADDRGVILRCDAASFPASVSWTWQTRAGGAGWRAAGTGRRLNLTRAAQSGYYRCQAHSEEAGLVQEELSPGRLVVIVSLTEQDVSHTVGVAALILALLLWLLLVPALLWVCVRANHLTRLQGLANSRDVAEPAKPPKGSDPEPMAEEGEVYMNYDTTSHKNYEDFIPGEDIYHIVA